MNKFLESQEYDNAHDVMEVFEQQRCAVWKHSFSLTDKGIKRAVSSFRKYLNEEKDYETYIGLYAYTKLIYSLLVVSDYYATSEFMNGTKITQFGSIPE